MATATPTKGELLSAVNQENSDWEALLAEIGEARMLEPGVMGEWRFKDLVAHLAGWDDYGLRQLEAEVQGRPAPEAPWPAGLTGDDPINQWMYEQNQDRLLGEVLNDTREIYSRLAAVIEMTPDESWDDPAFFPSLEGKSLAAEAGGFFGHRNHDHKADVRAWLATEPEASTSNTSNISL